MNVTFDEAPIAVVTNDPRGRSGLVGFLLRHHIVRTLAQAQVLLLVLAIVIFILAGMLGRASMRGDTIDTRKNFVPAVLAR